MEFSVVRLKCEGCMATLAAAFADLDAGTVLTFDLAQKRVAVTTTRSEAEILKVFETAGFPALRLS